MPFCNSISMKSSYMQFFFLFLPITWHHGDQVTKCHYRSLKYHYRLFKNVTIGLNSILRKSSFKKRRIFLISFRKRAKCWIFFKKGKGQFFPGFFGGLILVVMRFFIFYFSDKWDVFIQKMLKKGRLWENKSKISNCSALASKCWK